MAETAVGSVLDRLIPLLNQEVSLLRGVRSQVLDIKRELQMIQCFLRDADRRAEAEAADTSRDGVKVWVEQVREVAFRIEDVIDEYTVYIGKHPRGHGFVGSFSKIGRAVKLKERYDIASQIEDIKAKVREIKERSERYGFDFIHYQQQGGNSTNNPVAQIPNDPRMGSLFLKEAEVVGIQSDRDKLIGWLVDDSPHRTVVSVVGMGGVGKTTLAKRVYDRVITQFDCHVWITVSESYNRKELLRKLMNKFCRTKMTSTDTPRSTTGETDEEMEMIERIRKYLKNKRYVVFFDDVWKKEFWTDIEHALFDNENGGRIVITTRSLDVANFCQTSSLVQVHMLQPLSFENGWQLFCNKAFQFQFGGSCPPELENYSHKIVVRCQGLPLAIVAIAGLLSTKKKTVDEWRKFHDNLSSELESNPQLTSITRILSLSYNDLPCNLKSCFLYFGLYPEDYSINCQRLIRQWVAESFVTPKNDKTLEEVAQDYLTELMNRSLVLVSRLNLSTGEPKECCIHDLLRQMILEKMRNLHFGCHSAQNGSSFMTLEVTRRLAIDEDSNHVLRSIKKSRVRSILTFDRDTTPNFVRTRFRANFKLLKLLDLQHSILTQLPNDIGSLFLLKYLSVAYTKVQVLPRSIGKLQNLETLNLKHSLVLLLPIGINRLHKLRHLLAGSRRFENKTFDGHFEFNKGVELQKGFGCLEALQKLYNVELNLNAELMAELRKLKQLRKLGILNVKTESGRSLCEGIKEMKHLECLAVQASSCHEVIDMDSLSYSPPEFLRSLVLKGRLWKLPDWIMKLQNLSKLEIRWSRLNDDPLKVLQNLVNLVVLRLIDNVYDGEQLYFMQGGFPKLKYLELFFMSELNSLVIKEGAMTSLEQLYINYCHKLKEVPFGIQHLRNLKELSFIRMLPSLEESLRPEGRHYHIVQHVPKVWFRG